MICEICRKHREWFEKNNVCINLYGRDTLNNLKTLEKKIQHKEISNILKVNGPVYGDEKGKILSTAYAFIQCSRHEGQPMGILEALSIGTPCIVTYGTSLGEYINNTNCGFGCEFNNDKVFFAIKKLCENPKMRDVFSKNAKINSLTDFSWEKVIDKTYKEYLKIV